ncbi:conserved hypothetical protein [Exiguobacterium sp. 8H]|uniref:hypothetical protein n=1 Tax=unclassified Exiguobacterium TaxID=2644629 RepID=UPI0012EF4103|nr:MULTISPECIES: hypothetical protein [unclassified Exiguobacterium]VXB64501.1 conserved hypothetical protein [Exiguobacterium sp. 8A]VXB65641.1 conserved hypothetical protein [Exiguobacterium sp. 8H]
MRTYWGILLSCILLSGCGAETLNAIELRPLSSYRVEQDPEIPLMKQTQEKLLTYCERRPTDVLPERRAKVAEVTFHHPLYEVLGSKTVKYFAAGDERYVTCANSNELMERTFAVEPIQAFEALEPDHFQESKVVSTIEFERIDDLESITSTFTLNETHEEVMPDSAFRYTTPDTGAIYVTFETIRNGRTLDPIIEPKLFPFQSGENEGYVFLTRRADDRLTLQIGETSSLKQLVLPNIYEAPYMKVDPKEEISLKGNHRELMKRIILSDRPIEGGVAEETSLSLSKTYGTVLEIWGHVRRPVTNKMSTRPAEGETRLAVFESEQDTIWLDGPKTQELFDALSHIQPHEKTSTAVKIGDLHLYEELTEQSFDVWKTETELYLVDQHTSQSYELPGNDYFQVIQP